MDGPKSSKTIFFVVPTVQLGIEFPVGRIFQRAFAAASVPKGSQFQVHIAVLSLAQGKRAPIGAHELCWCCPSTLTSASGIRDRLRRRARESRGGGVEPWSALRVRSMRGEGVELRFRLMALDSAGRWRARMGDSGVVDSYG